MAVNMAFDVDKVWVPSTDGGLPAAVGDIFETQGKVFIFLPGVSGVDSTHRWVTFDADHTTALLTAGAKGRCAVFAADVDATTKYGWAQIYGKCAFASSDAIATNSVLYIDATAGRVDDAAVTGDLVLGAVSRSTDASTNIFTVELNYPQVTTKIG